MSGAQMIGAPSATGALEAAVAAVRRGQASHRWVALFVAVYLALLGMGGLAVHRSTAQQQDALARRFDARAATASRFVQSYVADVLRREEDLARLRLTGQVTETDFGSMTREHGFAAAVLLDGRGRLLAVAPANPKIIGTDVASRYAHLRAGVAGHPKVSDVVPGAARGVPVVGFAVPFDTPSGRRVFSGAFEVGRTPLKPYLENLSSLRSFRAYLVDSAGAVVALGGSGDGGGNKPEPSAATLAQADPALARAALTDGRPATAGSGIVDLAGEPRYWTATAVPGTPWRLMSTVPTSVLYEPVNGSGRWIGWIALSGVAAAGLALIVLFTRHQAHTRRLLRSEDQLSAVLDSTSDAFIGMDDAGLITKWNPAAARLLGWSAAEAINRPLAPLIIPERFRAAHERAMSRFLATGSAALSGEPLQLTALHRDGQEIHIEIVIAPVRCEEGWRFHAFLRDIGPRLAAEEQSRTLAAVVTATADAVISHQMDGTITSWNAAAERLYGYTAEEAIGQNISMLLPTDDENEQRQLAAALRLAAVGQLIDSLEATRRRKDGTSVPVSMSIAPLTDARGKPIGVCSSARDVTESRRQAAELRQAQDHFRLAFDAVPTGMILTGLAPENRGRMIRVNSGVCWMLGYTKQELEERTFTDITHPDDRDDSQTLMASFIAGHQQAMRFEKRYIRSDGAILWAMVSAAVVHDPEGRPRYVITQIDDITALRAENERLTALALTDSLTGLANRLLFEDRLKQAAHRSSRHGQTLAVIYCDLDGFKPVNDQFGHDAGDELLRHVGHRLQSSMRPSDTIARLGGDEFAVLCEGLPDHATAEQIAGRVRSTIEGTYLVSAGAVTISVSLGIATASGPNIKPRELLTRADLSMYTDKRSRHATSPVPSQRGTPTDLLDPFDIRQPGP